MDGASGPFIDHAICLLLWDPAAPRGGYSASSYVEVLEENIPTIYEPGLLFMQDNAPIHTARKVRE